MYIKLLLLFLFLSHQSAQGQQTIGLVRASEKITVDGLDTETAWSFKANETYFKQFSPNPSAPSSQKTSVKLLYDDDALYVFAICYDEPHKVSKILSLRDDFNANTDNFQIILDTYNDDQNGFVFGVSSMGVQYDSKIFISDESKELNMVWNSSVKHTTDGWQVEMRIPYSAFRFPKVENQKWGVNFYRQISRFREESSWNPIKPDFDNFVAQCGTLEGINGIQPPLRLAFMPYVSCYANHYDSNLPDTKDWSFQFNGGMDIKLGLNEAFTLDMTLVPDFGQAVFDNQVLNLSPFEIQFNENRQFFTEGTELFNKSGLFYSRRIGIQAPRKVLETLLGENEQLTNVPAASQLYNAAKVSGRSKKGLGIAFFNAITASQTAKAVDLTTMQEREIEVSPLTNFNVLVLDQNLKNNSSVTFTNTYVLRSGSFYDATVTGLDVKLNTKSNKYGIVTWLNVSGKYESKKQVFGHTAGIDFRKQTGNFAFNTIYGEESASFDPNDLGFNTVNNKRIFNQRFSYRIFKPFWKLNRLNTTIDFIYNRLYSPNVYTSTDVNWSLFVNSKRFHAAGLNINSSVTKSYDYFEPRVWGTYFVRPIYASTSGWISSNYQKRFAIDANIRWDIIDDSDWTDWGYSISPRVRISNKIFLVYKWEHSFSTAGQGYAVAFGVPVETSESIVFGNRNRTNVINTININYTMTNLMGITFKLRHYRSHIHYNYFYDLQADGSIQRNELTGLDADGESAYNTNFNAFTIDFVYSWVFRPGSQLTLVWKNSIFTNDKRVSETYLQNLGSTFENNALNSISIKLLYWIDYQDIKRLFKKK
ncbi:MAG: DUF5916 domain-containing protein [Crocinitomicaceae bacterium]